MPDIAVGERLGQQHAGDGAALGHHAAELLGDPERREPELAGFVEQLGRGRARRVGVRGRGAHLLGGERADRLAEHLLLLVGRQVEQVAVAGLP